LRESVLTIFVDAAKPDYLTRKRTPFLHRLAEEGVSGRIETIFAFSGILPTIFSGSYPEVHGIWTTFCYCPVSSSFRWIRPLLPVISLFENIPDARTALTFGISALTGIVNYLEGHTAAFTHGFQAHAIPFHLASCFDFSMKKVASEKGSLSPVTTLFDILRDTGTSFSYVDLPLVYTESTRQLRWWVKYSDYKACEGAKSLLRKHKSKFFFLHLCGLDAVAHQYGPWSKRSIEEVKQLDYLIEDLATEFGKHYESVKIVIFGDHGMVDVDSTLDIRAQIEESGLEEKKDYLIFLDSTMARFWFKSKEARIRAIEVLGDIKRGRILTEDDFTRFRINFPHTKYGEVIFLLDSGVVISPNYFQGSDVVKGMHGYDPINSGLDTVLIVHGSRVAGRHMEKAKLVDVFPTLLDILRLPASGKYEGKSVLNSSQRLE